MTNDVRLQIVQNARAQLVEEITDLHDAVAKLDRIIARQSAARAEDFGTPQNPYDSGPAEAFADAAIAKAEGLPAAPERKD